MRLLLPALLFGCTPSPPSPDETGDETATDETGRDDTGTEEAPCPPLGDPLSFSEPSPILQTEGNAKSPTLAIVDDAVHVAWHDFSYTPTRIVHAVQTEGAWSTQRLELTEERAIRPRLVVDGDEVHLFFDVYENDTDWAVYMSTRRDGVFGPAIRLGDGEKVDAAVFEGVLHAVWFDGTQPVHRMRIDGEWSDGAPIRVPAYVQTFRLRLLAGNDLELLIATSPGEVSYDPELFTWSDGSWTSRPLYTSVGLSSDDVSGAVGADGVSHWVWTEQSAADPWTIPVAHQRSDETTPEIIHALPGFSTSPDLAVSPDGVPVATWVDDTDGVRVSRAPWGEPLRITASGTGPRIAVDRCGFSHLVYYGRDGDGPQDIYYSRNPG